VPWHYRSPQTFPAIYASTLREAVLEPDNPIIIWSGSAAEVASHAERYRWFRWCIRHDPGQMLDLFTILETYDIRTKAQHDFLGSILYVIAKPTKLSEFIRLNPLLADEMLSECQ
jgi:hypothetical protein